MPAILFVCTGNQCRSPVAETLLRQKLARIGQNGWRVESAGTWAVRGAPAPASLQQAAQQAGLDLSRHRARSIDDVADLGAFDAILTMERGQQEALRVEYPTLHRRIQLLSTLAGAPYDIPDPIGRTAQHYANTVQELTHLLQRALPKILRQFDPALDVVRMS